MQTSVPKGSENTGESDMSFGTNVGLLIGYMVAASAFIIFATFLRERCCQRCYDDKGSNSRRGGRRDAHLESDRALAEEVQRRLDEEFDAERIIKENERRVWYESYMKKFTMVRDGKKITVR
jgi:hypothetical protein